jgi:hypothetical protein
MKSKADQFAFQPSLFFVGVCTGLPVETLVSYLCEVISEHVVCHDKRIILFRKSNGI